MVRDGRTLDHKTLEEIRRMAVERVREGETPSAVIASRMGSAVRRFTNGSRRRSAAGAATHFVPARAPAAPIGWPRSKSARYSGGSTARIPANTALISVCGRGRSSPSLIAERFGVELSLASVGKLLSELNLTLQKPLTRAYERDPAAWNLPFDGSISLPRARCSAPVARSPHNRHTGR
jgi:hypothetical protein